MKIHYKRVKIYYDFETTQIESNNRVRSWVVFYLAKHGNLNPHYRGEIKEQWRYHYGISINSFMDFIEGIDRDTFLISFNGAKFDNHFILGYLSRNYVRYTTDNKYDFAKDHMAKVNVIQRRKQHSKWFTEYISNKYIQAKDERAKQTYKKYLDLSKQEKWKLALPGEFDEFSDNNKRNYETTIYSYRLADRHWRPRTHKCRDIALLLPPDLSLADIGETLNKTYQTNKYTKLPMEHKPKPPYQSIEEFESDGNELAYNIQDVFILASIDTFLNDAVKNLGFEKLQMTQAMSAYRYWIYELGHKINKERQNPIPYFTGKNGIKKLGKYTLFQGYKYLVQSVLPTKWLDDIYYPKQGSNHSYLYNWYQGGLVKVNELYRGLPLKTLIKFDLVSSYPAQMVKDVLVPYGKPSIRPLPGYNFKFYEILVLDDIINNFGLPNVKIPGSHRNFPKKIPAGTTVYKTDIDLNDFIQYYNAVDGVNIEIIPKFYFKSKPIKWFFKEYIDKMFRGKERAKRSGDGVMKLFFKIMLNALYGKLGTKKHRKSKVLMGLEWIQKQEDIKSKFYLPLAICITALGRKELVDAVGLQYQRVVYTDTDCLVFHNTIINKHFPHMRVGKQLGNWEPEFDGRTIEGIFRRPKQYLINDGGKQFIALSSVNSKKLPSKLSYQDFIEGFEAKNQVQAVKSMTGVYLKPVEKIIPPVWDYPVHREQKFIDRITYWNYYHYCKDNYYGIIDIKKDMKTTLDLKEILKKDKK